MRQARTSVGLWARRLGLSVATMMLMVGCSSTASPTTAPSGAASAPAGGASVTAALSEFKIELGAATAAAGPVTFAISNKGTTVHEFVVFDTALAADKLPLAADGTEVDEEGAGLTAVDEVEDIAAGATASLAVTLPAGHYVVICNLPAHYTSGMRAEFTTGS